MHWYVYVFLGVMLAWSVVGLFMSMVLRRMPWPSRFVVGTIFGLITMGVMSLGWQVMVEHAFNLGPYEYGAMDRASAPLIAKYGNSTGPITVKVISFEPDTDNSGSGTYRIRYDLSGHQGDLYSHYNKAGRKFDRDEVKEDE